MKTNTEDKPNSKMVSFRMPVQYVSLLQELSDKFGLPKSEILRRGLDSLSKADQGIKT